MISNGWSLSEVQFSEKSGESFEITSTSTPELYDTQSPVTICVNNKMRETLEFKIYYKGAYASYQYIISLLSLDQLISPIFAFNLLT